MLNILFLSELFHPHGGGAELATYLYAKLLSERGFDVVVVTNRFVGEPETSKRQNLEIYRVPIFRKGHSNKYAVLKRLDVLFSSFMRKLIMKADVVYVPRFWYSTIPLAKLYRKPVLVHLHDYVPVCPLSVLYNAFDGTICRGSQGVCSLKCIYTWEKTRRRGSFETISSMALNPTLAFLWRNYAKLCDAIVCVSKTHANITTKAHASLRSKIHVIYNPLPNIPYEDVEGDDYAYLGGLNYLKGIYILYQAVERINHDGRRAIQVHATNFPKLSSPFLDILRNTGFTLHQRLMKKQYNKLYRQIRCVIVPSIWQETFSYTVVEALLRGRLVIASKIGAIPEVVSGCDGALLFSAGSFEQLVERILSVKDMNRETIVDLGIRSRKAMERRFSNEKTISEFVHLLNVVSDNRS